MKGFIRRGRIVAVALLCVLLAGCGTPMAKLTPEEENLIVAYAAGSVAKGNKYMTQGLTYPKPEEAEDEEEPEAEPGEDKTEEDSEEPKAGAGDAPQDGEEKEPAALETTLSEALKLDPVSVEYRGYDLQKNYVVGDYFALNAGTGKTFLVLHIGLVNTSQEAVECNIYSKNLTGSIYINDVLTADTIVTVLTEDFTSFMGTVDASSESGTVALFEVPEEAVQEIQSLSMDLEVEGVVYHISLG